jgi:hypothetical protein
MIEVTCPSETVVDFQCTTRCYIPEDINIHNHRYEKRHSYNNRFPFQDEVVKVNRI